MTSRTAGRMGVFTFMALLACGAIALAQAASHFLGTIASIDGNVITVKTQQGDERQVQVPSTASLKRIEPGQTSLSAAVAMQFSELAAGDRVLIWTDPNVTTGTPQAVRLVAIKAQDLAQKQQQEAEDWQKRGVGGLVKSVDPATGIIVITSGAGPTAKTVIIHTGSNTVLKRYAPASVSYALARPAPITDIHPGDQLMARGDRNEAGVEVAAEEVVSGSFRNISGVISSLDPAKSTFTVKDLATKKQVTVQVPDDAQMRRLPDRMAQFLAARLKGATPAVGARAGAAEAGAENGGEQHVWTQRGGNGGGMDAQQILSRAPVIHFADLQKGEAVMLVATPGDAQVTAITLVAGVEPLLEAPASQDLLANWSMGSGGAEAASAGQP
jgi:hypothetical protein